MSREYTRKQVVRTAIISASIAAVVSVSIVALSLNVNIFGASLQTLELKQVNEIIQKEFYGSVEESQLQAGAISGAVSALGDIHSSYMSADETAAFRERLESSFEGIGAMIQSLDGKIVISEVLEGSPALKAGLQQNDQIQAVDGNSVENQSLDEVIAQVKGPAGSEVVLTLWRNGEIIDLPITRASISQESAATMTLDQEETYGYIDMRQSFGASTAREFAHVLEQLGAVSTLVIDLRDNPGGYLDAVSEILSTLVSSAQPYVIIEDRNGNQREMRSDLTENAPYDYVVLVNENTASAAEIMSAALQQLADATIVGTTTYGKGTVQKQFDLLDGGVLKLTVEHWLTPNGTSINEVGVTPDVEVSPSIYYQLPTITLSETIQVDQANTKVLTAQYMLSYAGYEIDQIDGVFHESLVGVLKQFQTDQKLPVTGVIDVPTANALNTLLKAYTNDYKNDVQLQRAIELVQ